MESVLRESVPREMANVPRQLDATRLLETLESKALHKVFYYIEKSIFLKVAE